MKKTLLLLFILTSTLSFAQLQIVRDPIACAYGLKNADKKWVVPAQYQEIQLQGNGFFTFELGEKWGILTRTGTVFESAKYDQIHQLTPAQFMLVSKKEQDSYIQNWVGILDTSKVWVLPQVFSSIQQLNQGRFLVVKTSYPKNAVPKHQSSIVDKNGEPLTPTFDGMMIYKFNEPSIFVVGDNLVESSTVKGNVRFYSADGKALSDSTFDVVTPCGENYTVLKNNKYGLFSAEGKPIVWPKYQFEFNSYNYSNALPCLHSHHQFIFTENGKKGILNGDWKVHLPPIYEKLITIYTQVQTPTSARLFGYLSETNSYDLIDANGKKLAEADTFITKNIRVPKTNYYDSDAYRIYFFFGKRQGKGFNWGIMDEKGVVLVPAINATILITNNFEALLVEDPTNSIPQVNRVLLTEANAAGFKMQPVNFKAKLDSIYLFQYEQQFYPIIYDQTQKIWRQEMYGYNLPKSFGNLLLISGNMGGFIFDKSTNQVTKVKHIDLYNGGLPTVQTEDGMNLIHPKKGFLFKEYFLQINQQFASKNRIWVQTSKGKWRIYDTLGVQRNTSEFDIIAYDWEAIIVQSNYKKGLLDENCNWLIQPVFADLFQVTKNLYVGITPTKKVGVIDRNNPTKIDTNYVSFIPLYFSSDGTIFYYCLEKSGVSTCFDINGEEVSQNKKDIITSHWLDATNFQYFSIQCNNIDYKAVLEKRKDLVYNHLYWMYWNQLKSYKNVVLNGERGIDYQPGKIVTLEFASEKSLSLSIAEQARITTDDFREKFHGSSIPYFEVTNWIFLENGTSKKIVFSDLFNPNNPLYQKAITEAIQDNPGIHIDCSRPDALFNGASSFSIVKGGVKLYFYNGQYQAFELILSKAQLAKIPSAKWILGFLD